MGEYSASQVLWLFYIQLAIQLVPGVAACAYALWTGFVDNPDAHYVIGEDERDFTEEGGFLPQARAA
jgi:hypothetical protein